MKAIILSAGKGERLRPITDSIAKVMVEVGGKPCLQHNIEFLVQGGVKQIGINLHYLPETITEYFKDGRGFGATIYYSHEPEILGTSGSLNNFRNFLKEETDFIVVYGDVIHKTDIQKIIRFHRKRKGIATLALDGRSQVGKGVVICDSNGRITEFVEKPKQHTAEGLINSGVYILNRRILDFIPDGKFSDFGYDIFPKLLDSKEEMYGIKIGEVVDIGTIDDLKRARALFN